MSVAASVATPGDQAIDALVTELRTLEVERRKRRGLTLIEASRLRELHELILKRVCAPPLRERRESLRVPCEVRVIVQRKTGERLEGWARDFGAGGLFIELSATSPLEDREVVLLAEVSLDQRSRTHFAVHGRIVHRAEQGIGLELEPRGYAETTRARALFFDLLRRILESER